MGLQIRSDLFAADNKVLGSKSVNIVDNMQRMLTEKKARDPASMFDLLKEKEIVKKRFQVKHELGKMEALKKKRAEKRAAAVGEFWRAVLRERKMKVESERAKQEEEEERKEMRRMRDEEWEEKERELEEMGKRRREAAKEKLDCEIEVIEVSDEEEVMVEEGNGRWFNARTILLEMTASQGKKSRLDEVLKFESPIETNEQPVADIEASEEVVAGGGKKYSDHLGDAVKVVCKLCNSCESLTAMRGHTKKSHKMTIATYRERFGQLADHMVEEVYHKCRMCDKTLLLDADLIYHHARTHGLSFKEYTSKYLTLKNKRKSS